jgi:hypothetical protein
VVSAVEVAAVEVATPAIWNGRTLAFSFFMGLRLNDGAKHAHNIRRGIKAALKMDRFVDKTDNRNMRYLSMYYKNKFTFTHLKYRLNIYLRLPR